LLRNLFHEGSGCGAFSPCSAVDRRGQFHGTSHRLLRVLCCRWERAELLVEEFLPGHAGPPNSSELVPNLVNAGPVLHSDAFSIASSKVRLRREGGEGHAGCDIIDFRPAMQAGAPSCGRRVAARCQRQLSAETPERNATCFSCCCAPLTNG